MRKGLWGKSPPKVSCDSGRWGCTSGKMDVHRCETFSGLLFQSDKRFGILSCAHNPREWGLGEEFRRHGQKCSENLTTNFTDFHPLISRGTVHKKFHENSSPHSTVHDITSFSLLRLWELGRPTLSPPSKMWPLGQAAWLTDFGQYLSCNPKLGEGPNLKFSNSVESGEPNRPLTPILYQSIALHLLFLSWCFCTSMPSSWQKEENTLSIVSRYASHLYRDTLAEVLGPGVVGTLPIKRGRKRSSAGPQSQKPLAPDFALGAHRFRTVQKHSCETFYQRTLWISSLARLLGVQTLVGFSSTIPAEKARFSPRNGVFKVFRRVEPHLGEPKMLLCWHDFAPFHAISRYSTPCRSGKAYRALET